MSYSYPDEELVKRPQQPANTLIEMGAPYCFHVPMDAMFEVKQSDETAYVVFKKVWTQRAHGSSDADYRSPTHVLYHNNTNLRTPNFPPEANLGPEPICTGVNVEALNDRSGLFRYSRVWVFLKTDYTRHQLASQAGAQTARTEVTARSIDALNRFIDVYRVVTQSAQVQRLSDVHIRDLFFREHNIGFHGASFGHGISTAVMNRSGAELAAIALKAASGTDIPAWDLLFLDAEASLNTHAFTLSVVYAFQALELRLEGFLERCMMQQGLAPAEIQESLDRTWRTKERLKDAVPSFANRRLIDDDRNPWDRFCWAYDEIRNKLIHAARALDYDKTARTVKACREVSQWLDSIGDE